MSDFQSAKLWLVGLLDLSKDAAHVHAGMLVFLLAAILLRRPLGDWRPLAIAILVALIGEAWDLYETWARTQPLRWDHSRHDLWNTLFWPALIFILARWTRLIRAGR